MTVDINSAITLIDYILGQTALGAIGRHNAQPAQTWSQENPSL